MLTLKTLGPSLAVLMVGSAAVTSPARADLNGFADFAPVNAGGHGTSVGYSADKTLLTLTDGGPHEAASAFGSAPQRIRAFRATFTYQATHLGGPNPPGGGDGAAFVVQNDPHGVRALGSDGNALGYGGGADQITRSGALRLSIFPDSGEGVGIGGASEPYGDTGGVDLRSGHPIQVTLDYDGAVLTETLKDQTTGDAATEEHALDLPAAVGGDTALVGFTGASGDATAAQAVSGFAFTVLPDVPPAQRKHIHVIAKTYRTLADYVDPFIGTDGGGNCYPGAVAPFGMVQFSPDTGTNGIGYGYGDHQIAGFSLTHMSGVGCDDYGDVFLTATTGPVQTQPADYRSPYSHRQESASPGYYQVRLTKFNVNAELTATLRAGVARFTFPANQVDNILVPISHTLTHTYAAQAQVVGDDEIDGSVTSQSFCGAGQRYSVYFAMRFDRPFDQHGTWTGATLAEGGRAAAQTDDGQPPIGAYVRYLPAASISLTGTRSVTARIGISFVDIAGARENLKREVGGKSFEAVRRQTARDWEKELGVLTTDGGATDQRVRFYTALYHALLMPNVFSDADGRYIGFDNQIHQTPNGHLIYANYSGWDIYRTEVPLLALVAPQRLQDMCQSIALMYRQGGWIDRWPQANTYTNVMCGSPLTTMVATAWNAGLRDFDIATAYEGMMKDATQPPPPGKPYGGESNVHYMDQVGYIPDDKEGYGSVSQTEEDCIAYSALASVAASLGRAGDAAYLSKRALNYRNLFDPDTKFLRPRLLNGQWQAPFDPAQEHGYVEGSAWHYRWLAPQDVAGLIRLMGGDDAFNAEMDKFFSYPHPVWDDHYYNPYNETDLEAPFLYDFSGVPWKTQARVRELQADAYKITPDGIPGNDDCGTMSSWYVLSAMGLYAVDAGRPFYELCSPLFPKVALHLSRPYAGRAFTVSAPAASDENQYVQSARLNSAALPRCWVPTDAITQGGSLTFTLGASPNKDWGAAAENRPPSLSH
ncbi:MAG: GH92 family glycosyl hydrolase [Armatimonadetes bacterium]|nr:GH92 family glycosyl hydrolase [Armatimonadota bacterium]